MLLRILRTYLRNFLILVFLEIIKENSSPLLLQVTDFSTQLPVSPGSPHCSPFLRPFLNKAGAPALGPLQSSGCSKCGLQGLVRDADSQAVPRPSEAEASGGQGILMLPEFETRCSEEALSRSHLLSATRAQTAPVTDLLWSQPVPPVPSFSAVTECEMTHFGHYSSTALYLTDQYSDTQQTFTQQDYSK